MTNGLSSLGKTSGNTMGYFSANLKTTIESSVDNAIANLKLWQRASTNDPCNYSYLIGMAMTDLEEALKRITAEQQRREKEKKNGTT